MKNNCWTLTSSYMKLSISSSGCPYKLLGNGSYLLGSTDSSSMFDLRFLVKPHSRAICTLLSSNLSLDSFVNGLISAFADPAVLWPMTELPAFVCSSLFCVSPPAAVSLLFNFDFFNLVGNRMRNIFRNDRHSQIQKTNKKRTKEYTK